MVQVGQIYDEIHDTGNLGILVHDQYGNYVVQYMVEYGRPSDKRYVFALVKEQLTTMSCHKFASNIVEKCLTDLDDQQRDEILTVALHTDRPNAVPPLLTIMKDKFGNYIVQRLMHLAKGSSQEVPLMLKLKENLPLLQKLPYGKHILYALREQGFMPEEEMAQVLSGPGAPIGNGNGQQLQ